MYKVYSVVNYFFEHNCNSHKTLLLFISRLLINLYFLMLVSLSTLYYFPTLSTFLTTVISLKGTSETLKYCQVDFRDRETQIQSLAKTLTQFQVTQRSNLTCFLADRTICSITVCSKIQTIRQIKKSTLCGHTRSPCKISLKIRGDCLTFWPHFQTKQIKAKIIFEQTIFEHTYRLLGFLVNCKGWLNKSWPDKGH